MKTPLSFALFDDFSAQDLLPFTYTRPVSQIRIGIDTLKEKWESVLQTTVFQYIGGYLAEKFHSLPPTENDVVFINAKFVPQKDWVEKWILSLEPHSALVNGQGECAAFRGSVSALKNGAREISSADLPASFKKIEVDIETPTLRNVWDIFQVNGQILRLDFQRLTEGRESAPIEDRHTIVYAPENIFVEEGATLTAAILNARSGPIYIGAKADIQEGAIIHGAHAIGTGAVVNMGAKLRGDSTIGPYCKVGGEVSNSVLFGYSNKGHDGFLGNSVLGEWCNLGADTNTSNLKNNYSTVRVYHFGQKKSVDTGLTFCGLMMGDHSKAGINTMFNTGTVAGVCANIFGGDFPPKMIPSFSWGGAAGFETFDFDKACEVAARMMQRRKIVFDDKERAILKAVLEQSAVLEK